MRRLADYWEIDWEGLGWGFAKIWLGITFGFGFFCGTVLVYLRSLHPLLKDFYLLGCGSMTLVSIGFAVSGVRNLFDESPVIAILTLIAIVALIVLAWEYNLIVILWSYLAIRASEM